MPDIDTVPVPPWYRGAIEATLFDGYGLAYGVFTLDYPDGQRLRNKDLVVRIRDWTRRFNGGRGGATFQYEVVSGEEPLDGEVYLCPVDD